MGHIYQSCSDRMSNNKPDEIKIDHVCKTKRGENFTASETCDLLEIWASGDVQSKIKRNRQNTEAWNLVKTSMTDRGYHRTAQEYKTRVERLTKTFYEVRKGKRERILFPYYDRMENVLPKEIPTKKKRREQPRPEETDSPLDLSTSRNIALTVDEAVQNPTEPFEINESYVNTIVEGMVPQMCSSKEDEEIAIWLLTLCEVSTAAKNTVLKKLEERKQMLESKLESVYEIVGEINERSSSTN